jgi:hypothetical protein
MVNELVKTSKVTESLKSPICKINISGFSLDNFKNFYPENYTILCGTLFSKHI